MSFKLPELPYAYDALEPHIDAATMKLHHQQHHGGYVTKLNKAIGGRHQFDGREVVEIIFGIRSLPDDIRTTVRNNGGGHFNHSLFWTMLSPQGGGKPGGPLAQAIEKSFKNFDAFQDAFNTEASSCFGSGWAWLCLQNDRLVVCSTPNQDNPVMDIASCRGIPILGLDVWEHAYYLKHQNRRADYIETFWNVVNWQAAEELYEAAPSLQEQIGRLVPL